MTQGSQPASETQDVQPVVRTAQGGKTTLWLFGAALAIGGLLFFNALNARRTNLAARTDLPVATSGGVIMAPPPLNIQRSDDLAAMPSYPYVQPPMPVSRPQPAPAMPSYQPVSPIIGHNTAPFAPVLTPPDVQPRPIASSEPAVIESPGRSVAQTSTTSSDQVERVTATRLINPSLTVPQGTIIAAVLETALDSTRPGAVRAVVSSDVRSFDGSHVLIPRGSRLYGEYSSDVSPGQKRAIVMWHRLTRPDAVIIDLGSPASDPLGRTGIRGKVDSHFIERFGGSILQTGLDIGTALATRSIIDYPIILALPGGSVRQREEPAKVVPTLKVEQGTSVSVFVARDLDFSTVDR